MIVLTVKSHLRGPRTFVPTNRTNDAMFSLWIVVFATSDVPEPNRRWWHNLTSRIWAGRYRWSPYSRAASCHSLRLTFVGLEGRLWWVSGLGWRRIGARIVDGSSRFRWCDGGGNNSSCRHPKFMGISGADRRGCRGGWSIVGWYWLGGEFVGIGCGGGWWLFWWFMMGEVWIFFDLAGSQKNPIDLSKSWKSKFDGLCWWPFLAMKTLSHHSQPIHQNVGLLFSFSNPSEFWSRC